MKYSTVVVSLFYFYTNPAMSDWLCVTDLTTGFWFDGKEWVSSEFDVSGDRFIIRSLDEVEIEAKQQLDELTNTQLEKPTHGKYMFGQDSPQKYCLDHGGYINCVSYFGEFKFSKTALRFIETHSNGYWYGEDNNDNNPGISIGSCTEI